MCKPNPKTHELFIQRTPGIRLMFDQKCKVLIDCIGWQSYLCMQINLASAACKSVNVTLIMKATTVSQEMIVLCQTPPPLSFVHVTS